MELRVAYLLRSVHLQPPTNEEFEKELQVYIVCTKAVLPNYKFVPPTAAAKKQKENAKSSAKRPLTKGVMPTNPLADVARKRTIIDVVYEGNSQGKISRAQWEWVQASLTNAKLKMPLSNPSLLPSCTDEVGK